MNLTIFQYAKSNPRVGLKLDNEAINTEQLDSTMIRLTMQTHAGNCDIIKDGTGNRV